MEHEKKDTRLLLVLIFLVALLLVFRPEWGVLLERAIRGERDSDRCDASRAEIDRLKTELAKFRYLEARLLPQQKDGITAFVYSRYPFNVKNEFLIAAGEASGISEGQAVLADGVFIGRVEKVRGGSAVVQTIFDPRFRLAVRVGASGADALLVGGVSPRLTLIPKNAGINTGDAVYTASPEFPYGTPLGRVREMSLSSDELFMEATLEVAAGTSEVVSVFVITGHAP